MRRDTQPPGIVRVRQLGVVNLTCLVYEGDIFCLIALCFLPSFCLLNGPALDSRNLAALDFKAVSPLEHARGRGRFSILFMSSGDSSGTAHQRLVTSKVLPETVRKSKAHGSPCSCLESIYPQYPDGPGFMPTVC